MHAVHKMRPIATDASSSVVCMSVCVSVCLLLAKRKQMFMAMFSMTTLLCQLFAQVESV